MKVDLGSRKEGFSCRHLIAGVTSAKDVGFQSWLGSWIGQPVRLSIPEI